MIPFCASRGGGDQEMRAVVDEVTVTVTLTGERDGAGEAIKRDKM